MLQVETRRKTIGWLCIVDSSISGLDVDQAQAAYRVASLKIATTTRPSGVVFPESGILAIGGRRGRP